MIKKAVILVNVEKKLDGVPIPLVKVGGVPLLKRIVLDIRRAGIEEIFIVLDKQNSAIEEFLDRVGLDMKLHLMTDGWRADLLDGRGEGVLLLFGDRLYDFRMLATLGSIGLNGYDALVAVDLKQPDVQSEADRRYIPNNGRLIETSSQPLKDLVVEVGAYVYTYGLPDVALSFSQEDMQRLNSMLIETGQAAYFDIGNGFFQPIASRQDIRKAEEKILRYIWKETDGIYARWNKRLALPLIKLLLRTPVTPNMISILGVLVSLVAGYFFSLGSYLHELVGALLSYFSALLDHVDGSIARLKSMESAFGCWLETVCDYIYYLSLAVGITLGLYWETSNRIYLALGCVMFLGALMSFAVTGYQRKKFTKNPSLYAVRIHRKLEDNAQNPIYRFGRTCYFLARRPVLPYYVFLFTVLDCLPFVLFMVALGANLVWMISLYSNRLFRVSAHI